MRKKKQWSGWKRIGAVLLAAAMVAGTGADTFAIDEPTKGTGAINPQTKVSLTIHKYEMESIPGNLVSGDGTENVNLPTGAKPLGEVGFSIYKVGGDETSLQQPAGAPTATGKTGSNGILKFSDIPQGRYLVVETSVPDKVYEKCANFLVDLPTMNPTGTGWNYAVHVYPKNAAVLGAVVLTKKGEGDEKEKLNGATFQLQKKEKNGTYTDIAGAVYMTRDGKIMVNDLLKGEYQFVEVSTAAGYGLDKTPVPFTISKNGTVDEKGNETGTVVAVSKKNYKVPQKVEKKTDKTTENYGNTVVWTLKPDVPGNIDTYKTYQLKDELDERLSYQKTVVKLNGVEQTGGYEAGCNGQNLTVKFTNLALLKGKTLTVEVYTKINEKALQNLGKIPNEATLEYENAFATKGTVKSEKPTVFTGGIKIFKYTEQGGKTIALSGAKFKLYRTQNDAINDENEVAGETTSAENGYAYYAGFAAGEYWVKETQAPSYVEDGETKYYQILKEPKQVTLAENAKDGVVELQIENKKPSFFLPKTGSNSMQLSLFSGLLMLGSAALVMALRRKAIFE